MKSLFQYFLIIVSLVGCTIGAQPAWCEDFATHNRYVFAPNYYALERPKLPKAEPSEFAVRDGLVTPTSTPFVQGFFMPTNTVVIPVPQASSPLPSFGQPRPPQVPSLPAPAVPVLPTISIVRFSFPPPAMIKPVDHSKHAVRGHLIPHPTPAVVTAKAYQPEQFYTYSEPSNGSNIHLLTAQSLVHAVVLPPNSTSSGKPSNKNQFLPEHRHVQ